MKSKIFDTVHLTLADHGVERAADIATEIVTSLAVQRMIPVLREYGVRLMAEDVLGEPRETVLAAESAEEAANLAALLNARDPGADAKAFIRNSGPWYEMDLVVPV